MVRAASIRILVGAVIVKEDTVIGKGVAYAYCGGLHAERNALKDCRERGNDPRARRFTSRWNPAVITVRHLPVPKRL